jgi:hypothetical protein
MLATLCIAAVAVPARLFAQAPPAHHGKSSSTVLVLPHDGVAYQCDLGADLTKSAAVGTEQTPTEDWQPVTE